METTCPPCQDSPLSTTANVISLLTFAFVLLVGIQLRITAISKATHAFHDLDLACRFHKRALRACRTQLQKKVPQAETKDALDALTEAEHEVAKLAEIADAVGDGYKAGLWKRVLWGRKFLKISVEMERSLGRMMTMMELSRILADSIPLKEQGSVEGKEPSGETEHGLINRAMQLSQGFELTPQVDWTGR